MSTNANTYERKARECRESVESVSLKRNAALDNAERNLCRITKLFVDGCEDFLMWEARIRAGWAKRPDTYVEAEHREIDAIAGLWFGCGTMLCKILDWADEQNLDVAASQRVRNLYASMLGVEVMDACLLPDHLAELARKASAEWKSNAK